MISLTKKKPKPISESAMPDIPPVAVSFREFKEKAIADLTDRLEKLSMIDQIDDAMRIEWIEENRKDILMFLEGQLGLCGHIYVPGIKADPAETLRQYVDEQIARSFK